MSNLGVKVKELSEIERRVLLNIDSKFVGFEDVVHSSGVEIDSVRRACAWLDQKGFAVISESEEEVFSLTSLGEIALKKGLPENVLLKTLKELGGKASFSLLENKSGLSKQEFMAALGINKRKAFVVINSGNVEDTGVSEGNLDFSLESALKNIFEGKKVEDAFSLELLKRGLVEKKKSVLRLVKISPLGSDAKKILSTQDVERVFDVEGEVPNIFLGKRAPYVQFLQQIRGKLVSLGFKEMPTSLITTEFFNFDVLYQPQNHPARTLTDTYQLKYPKSGQLPDKKIVDSIKSAHENGG